MSGVMMVTGGSRGIGAATAKMAAGRGYAVCVNYQRDAEAAEAVVAGIAAGGGKALAVQADVSRADEVVRLFETCDHELGQLTALVNNAGLAGPMSPLMEADPETIRHIVDVNVTGSILCAQEAVRRLSTRHGGQGGGIVNLSSGAATLGSPGEYVWYAATKGAIDTLTVGLSKELGGEGIRVNAVAPGLIKTEIHAASGKPDRVETMAPMIPMGRGAEAEEVAEAILWLLSDAASYVTGAVLRVAGGR